MFYFLVDIKLEICLQKCADGCYQQCGGYKQNEEQTHQCLSETSVLIHMTVLNEPVNKGATTTFKRGKVVSTTHVIHQAWLVQSHGCFGNDNHSSRT